MARQLRPNPPPLELNCPWNFGNLEKKGRKRRTFFAASLTKFIRLENSRLILILIFFGRRQFIYSFTFGKKQLLHNFLSGWGDYKYKIEAPFTCASLSSLWLSRVPPGSDRFIDSSPSSGIIGGGAERGVYFLLARMLAREMDLRNSDLWLDILWVPVKKKMCYYNKSVLLR